MGVLGAQTSPGGSGALRKPVVAGSHNSTYSGYFFFIIQRSKKKNPLEINLFYYFTFCSNSSI